MIDKIPTETILKTALSRGGDISEIFIEESVSTTIIHDDHKLETISSSTDAGIGIRVINDKNTAYGSTNDPSSLVDLAKSVSNAISKSRNQIPSININRSTPSTFLTVKQHPLGIPIKRKVEIVSRAAQIAWTTNKQIKQVRVVYRDKIRKIKIITSDKLSVSDEQPETLLLVHVIASDGKILQTAYEPIGGAVGFELFDKTLPEEIATQVAKRAITMLKALPAKSGPMPVILSSDAGGTMIHEAVGHGLEADLALQGLSVYSNRKGDVVASKLISVYDDATIPEKRGSFTSDDEGTPSQKTCLIENGILKNFLTDRVWSIRNNLSLTGNGRRESYQYPPIARMTNTLIAPGKNNRNEIIKDTHHGIYITRMGGGQVNTINGDFIFEIQEGYRIEHGKIGELIRGATLIGNGPKILEIIDRVGSDLGFSIGTCSKNGQDVPVSSAQPTIRIPEIIVGGIN